MAFLTGNISLNIYTDTAQTSFPQLNLPNFTVPFTNNGVTGVEPLYLNLAASTSQNINFNGITGITQFYIFSDAAALTVTLNGTALTLKQGVPGYIPLAVSSLSLTNLSSSLATNVTLILISG